MEQNKEYSDLIKKAIEAKKFSYSPYSKFAVGAAIVANNNNESKIFSGCNIENAAYFSSCAERTALVKAISEGYTKIETIAVVTDELDYGYPCGLCRQALVEYGGDIVVICAKSPQDYQVYKIKELLPHYFGPDSL